MKKKGIVTVLLAAMLLPAWRSACAQAQWIRPANAQSPAIWGIENGIVFGLWPASMDGSKASSDGGPRGLIRVGYAFKGMIYHLNYIAVEPVVNGKMEFSEISPSRVDAKWGKFMWAGDEPQPGRFRPGAITRGLVTHPDPAKPATEELSLYVFMEQFMNGAQPYLKLSIRSDRPEELCLEIFNESSSAPMERCALTATMGNYSRLRLLYLKNRVVHAGELYKGFDDIDFIEKEAYPLAELHRQKNGDIIVAAATDESFASLSAWPQQAAYLDRWRWRYQPFFKVTQYWRKEGGQADASLHARVNGRARYWGGGSRNKADYIAIPGGPSFENFELREKYYAGQKFYYGITREEAEKVMAR